MVVLVIMSLLVAAVIPMMAPATQTRRLREGARILNTMIGTAQAEAVGTNRLSGIWLEKFSVETGQESDRGAVMNVYYCEEPQPFAGFSDNSAVILRSDVEGGPITRVRFILDYPNPNNPELSYHSDPIPPKMLRPGDRIEVAGALFKLIYDPKWPNLLDNDGFFQATMGSSPAELPCSPDPVQFKIWNFNFVLSSQEEDNYVWTYPRPYVIHRLPVKTSTEPIQLPSGIVIDLEGSGDGSDYYGFFHDPLRPFPLDRDGNPIPNDNNDPVIILFAPDGTLSEIYRNAGLDSISKVYPLPLIYSPQGAIHLLVGRRENVNESRSDQSFTENNKANWVNLESMWVSISPQTGRVVTNENAKVSESNYNPLNYDPPLRPIYAPIVFQRLTARQFAESNLSLGGR